jgi:hypothetical protein
MPGAAQVNIIGNSVDWTGYAYQGYDAFYDDTVVAYLEGSTASLDFVWFNDEGDQVNVIESFVYMDWGAKYTGTGPAVVAEDMPETFGIDFTVPAAADAGGVPHGYFMTVGYQENDDLDGYWVNNSIWETPNGAINGTNVDFSVDYSPVVRTSLKLWKRDSGDTEWELLTVDTDYDFTDIMAYDGEFEMDTAPVVGDALRVTYQYYDNIGSGDTVQKTFYLDDDPIVADSLSVYIEDTSLETVTLVPATAYSFDRMAGVITMVTPPESFQDVLVRYQYYDLETHYNSGGYGATFVIVTQDQVDYTMAWRRYKEIYDTDYFNQYITGTAMQSWSQAEAARMKAEIEYREGQFAAAETDILVAVDKANAAVAAEAALYNSVETGLTGLLTGAGGVVDAYGAKLNAEAQNITDTSAAEVTKIKADAARERSYGTFVILIGVFLIIVAVALLILAIGLFLMWRRPRGAT